MAKTRKEYNQAAYLKRKNDPEAWAEMLKKQRERFAIVGHKKVPSKCKVCGKEWLGVMRKRFFCSTKCISVGENNGRWKGGRQMHTAGYIRVYAPNHPYAVRNLVSEHRLVMEKLIGRILNPDEVVHHVNGIKTDNRPENLELNTLSEHSREHWKKWKREGNSPVQIRTLNRLKRKNAP